MSWWFKACPKCGDDIFESKDLDGLDLKCPQCGKTVSDLEFRHTARRPVATGFKASELPLRTRAA